MSKPIQYGLTGKTFDSPSGWIAELRSRRTARAWRLGRLCTRNWGPSTGDAPGLVPLGAGAFFTARFFATGAAFVSFRNTSSRLRLQRWVRWQNINVPARVVDAEAAVKLNDVVVPMLGVLLRLKNAVDHLD